MGFFPEPAVRQLFQTDYEFVQSLENVLKNICLQDSDIRAIIITQSVNRDCYLYSPNNNYLRRAPANVPFRAELFKASGRRQLLPASDLQPGTDPDMIENVFAITSSFSRKLSDGTQQFTNLAICYSTEPFAQILENRSEVDASAGLFVTTETGAGIFSSNKQLGYGGFDIADYIKKHPQDQSAEYTGSDEDAPADLVTVNHQRYAVNAQSNPQRGYIAYSLVPYSLISRLPFSDWIFLVLYVIFPIILTVGLSMLSASLMRRRMDGLITGMKEIGSNNLSYRIPQDQRDDEFTYISEQFNDMTSRLSDQIEQTYMYEIQRRKAEYHALQTSINPHFLYNTLEAVRGLLDENGEEDAAEMIVILSRLMDYQIRGGHFVSIGEEVEKLKNYIELFSLRYSGDFSYKLEIPDAILKDQMPKYTFQPILENYFVHGYTPGEDNRFSVTAKTDGDDILVTFADNGRGMNERELEQLQQKLENPRMDGGSQGLSNVHERLQIVYGPEYGLTISSASGEGTIVLVRMCVHVREDVTLT